jgi:pSer/pThr/pTyr-binding forkhead associated (FHA) protein/uncharacterized RDD family membrane protein YckC
MPKLIVNPTSSARREIKLARTLLSIGRDPSNDLVLPDAMVSRRHAVIECRGNQYYLRDCNSSNGSVVNGDKVSERSLRDGDLVAIGTARLLYREELELEDPGAKVVQHPSAPRLHCPSCRADYRKGDLFCRECGAPLQAPAGPRKAVCASCGTAVLLPAKFCNACGARLPPEVTPGPSLLGEPPPAPLPSLLNSTESGEAVVPAGLELSLRPADVDGPAAGAAVADRVPRLTSGRGEPQRAPTFPVEEAPELSPESPPLAAADPQKAVARGSGPSSRPASKPWRPSVVARSEAPAPAPRPLAAPGPRVLAALVDALVVAFLQIATVGSFVYFSGAGRDDGAGRGDLRAILLPLGLLAAAVSLAAGYHVIFWALRGATPGKQLMGLLVTAEDGSSPGWGRALARGVGYALSTASLGIGFLMILSGGLGLHDRIAGTRVVPRRPGA